MLARCGIWGRIRQEGKLTGQGEGNNRGRKSTPSPRRKTGSRKTSESRLRLERSEAADYLAGMLKGLREVANGAELNFLAYLIEVALQEAQAEKLRADSR